MKQNSKLPRGVFRRGANQHYWIRYKDQHGKIHREHIGPFLEPAKRAVDRRRTDVVERKFHPDQVKARVIPFTELAKEYLEQARRVKRSWHHDETRLEILGERLKDVPIAELSPGRLETVLGDLAEGNEWKPATYNRYRALVSGVFRRAIKNGKATSNPIRETAHRKENNTRVRYLTAEEEADLFKVIRESSREWERPVLVALHSGMRRSEQFRTAQVPDGGLKWAHIDFRVGVIRLPRSKPGKAREIPMNSVLRQTLKAIPRTINSPYVFQETDPGKWLAEAVKAAEIDNFTWHDFRHTFASRLVMAGIPIRTVAELMGHTNLQTTMRYAHLAPGHLAQAVEVLTAPQPQNDAQEAHQKSTGMSTAISSGSPS